MQCQNLIAFLNAHSATSMLQCSGNNQFVLFKDREHSSRLPIQIASGSMYYPSEEHSWSGGKSKNRVAR